MNYRLVLAVLISLLIFSFFIRHSSVTGGAVLAPLRVIQLVDGECLECSGLDRHLSLLDSFNIPYIDEVIDVNSLRGSEFLNAYGISQLPSIIVYNLSFYPQVYEFYLSYGSLEGDGAYVFRSSELLGGFVYERVTSSGAFELVDYSIVNKSLGVTRGPVNSSIDIVMFGDFDCDYSRASLLVINELLELYDDVSFTFIPSLFDYDFPAKALECAGVQGRYWEFFDKLFNSSASVLDIMGIAYELDLFIDGFISCIEAEDVSGRIETYELLADSLGIEETPTFFINGLRIQGPFSISYFNDLYEAFE